jgi:hypothetical protein
MVKSIHALTAVIAFFAAQSAFCAEKVDAITWHSLQTYDVSALKKIAEVEVGKIVGVRCHFRSKRIQHVKPSWYEATLWYHNSENRRTPFSYIRVKVAQKDLPAFESLPSDLRPGPAMTIYGEVQKDDESAFVRLIGRRINRGPDRSVTISW